MPKRYGKRETWRRKSVAKFRPPAVVQLMRAMYDPHFMRAFRTWGCMRADAAGPSWTTDAEQCLDRTEARL